MAKEKPTTTIRELQRKLHALSLTYDRGARITIDENLNIELVTDTDRAEETPEESLKRAERQRKAILERAEASDELAPKLTIPLEALKLKTGLQPRKEDRKITDKT